MNKSITQSLAGRVGILTLLPFSISELSGNKRQKPRLDDALITGGYPRIIDKNINPSIFHNSYIHTYLERDVQQLINVGNGRTFQKFMALCAGRVGQLLNIADIATNCGINRETATAWLSILEASYVIFLLKPHHNNFNKRLIKNPKLYFYDTGLACALLGLRDEQAVGISPFRGPLFENFIVTDLIKQHYNAGMEPSVYFWRDQNGRIEVDCLIDTGNALIPIEIKSGSTVNTNYFAQLKQWQIIAGTTGEKNYVVYGGKSAQKRDEGQLIGWEQAGGLLKAL